MTLEIIETIKTESGYFTKNGFLLFCEHSSTRISQREIHLDSSCHTGGYYFPSSEVQGYLTKTGSFIKMVNGEPEKDLIQEA